jgi:hypothetical protein
MENYNKTISTIFSNYMVLQERRKSFLNLVNFETIIMFMQKKKNEFRN